MSVSHEGRVIQSLETVNQLQKFLVSLDTSEYFYLLGKFSVLLPHGSGKTASCVYHVSAALPAPDLMVCYRSQVIPSDFQTFDLAFSQNLLIQCNPDAFEAILSYRE